MSLDDMKAARAACKRDTGLNLLPTVARLEAIAGRRRSDRFVL